MTNQSAHYEALRKQRELLERNRQKPDSGMGVDYNTIMPPTNPTLKMPDPADKPETDYPWIKNL